MSSKRTVQQAIDDLVNGISSSTRISLDNFKALYEWEEPKMKVKIRVFGLTPHDDGEADAITVEWVGINGNLEKNKQYDLDALDKFIHQENPAKGSQFRALAAFMRTTLEHDQVGDVTVEELYGPNFATRGQELDLFSAFGLPPGSWERNYNYSDTVSSALLKTDKQIYQARMMGLISQAECDELLSKVDREGNAAKFRKDHPEYD